MNERDVSDVCIEGEMDGKMRLHSEGFRREYGIGEEGGKGCE